MKQRNMMLSIVIVSGLILTACGGGDGGGGNNGANLTVPNKPGTINAQNVQSVAMEALDFSSSMTGPVPIDPESIASGNLIPNTQATSSSNNTALAKSLALSKQISRAIRPTAVQACPDGGSVDEAEDGFSVSFNDCRFFGFAINGSIVATVSADNFDSCPGMFAAAVDFNNVSMTFNDPDEGGEVTLGMDGGISLDMSSSDSDIDAFCETISIDYSMSNFLMSLNAPNESVSVVIPNYSTTSTVNNDTGNYSYSLSATIPSLDAGGMVNVTTIEPIMGNSFNEYPSSGQIQVSSGADTVTVIINSSDPDDSNAVTVIYNGAETNHSWTEFDEL